MQNERDPYTPATMGRGLHRALRASRLVMVAGGTTHGVYGSNPCADATVNAYLTTGRLPAKNVTCRATPPDAAEAKNSTASPANRLSIPDAVGS